MTENLCYICTYAMLKAQAIARIGEQRGVWDILNLQKILLPRRHFTSVSVNSPLYKKYSVPVVPTFLFLTSIAINPMLIVRDSIYIFCSAWLIPFENNFIFKTKSAWHNWLYEYPTINAGLIPPCLHHKLSSPLIILIFNII